MTARGPGPCCFCILAHIPFPLSQKYLCSRCSLPDAFGLRWELTDQSGDDGEDVSLLTCAAGLPPVSSVTGCHLVGRYCGRLAEQK